MKVDHDVSATELAESWVNGNRSWVIDNLKYRHPAITALTIVQGAQDGLLSVGDCNSIANMLMEDLIEVRDTRGVEFTGRPI